MDIKQQIETYHLFIDLVKWGIITVSSIVILLAIFVA